MTIDLVEGEEMNRGRSLAIVTLILLLPLPAPVEHITNQSWHACPVTLDETPGSCSIQGPVHSFHSSSDLPDK